MTGLTVTLRQKAQISDRARADFVIGTQTHLPGAVVRGAFAARWLARHDGRTDATPGQRDEFIALFEGGVRYGPLFHADPPMPLSVLGHKYQPTDSCDYVDIDRATTDWHAVRCPHPECESPLEALKTPAESAPPTGRRIHVAIGERGVAARGQLVTRETLRPDLSFTGTVTADDPSLLTLLASLGPIRVGGRRTTHGLADIAFDPQHTPPLVQRRDDGLLVLALRSPGLFVDDRGCPQRNPNRHELRDVLGCDVRIERRWTRWTTIGGWHIASGLPKPTELAVAAGSTYLLAATSHVSDAALAALARRGLGLRRHEGFGDVGGAPRLRPGRIAREREQHRLRRVRASIAALASFATQSRTWSTLLNLLQQAADRHPGSADQLIGISKHWNRPQREAAHMFVTLPRADVQPVLDEWRRL